MHVYNKDGSINEKQMATAIQLLNELPNDSIEAIEMSEEITKKLFDGMLLRKESYRDGGSKNYILFDGTEIYYNNAFLSPDQGSVTITYPDGKIVKFEKEDN